MFNRVEVNSPERMTIAIGAWISLPGLPAPSATGISARPAASAGLRLKSHPVHPEFHPRKRLITYSDSRDELAANLERSCGRPRHGDPHRQKDLRAAASCRGAVSGALRCALSLPGPDGFIQQPMPTSSSRRLSCGFCERCRGPKAFAIRSSGCSA